MKKIIKIENNIPVPFIKKSIFDKLKVGDSFLFKLNEAGSYKTMAWRTQKKSTKRFTFRTISKTHARYWRIK